MHLTQQIVIMARDKFHYEFKHALENEGWNVTDDPLVVKSGRYYGVNLHGSGASYRGRKKEGEKIAIEVKTLALFHS